MTTGARTGPASFEPAGPLPFQPGPAGFVFGRATRSSLERRACESDSTKKPAAERLDATRPDARLLALNASVLRSERPNTEKRSNGDARRRAVRRVGL